MGGCLTVNEMTAELDQMRSLYPNLISAKTDASATGKTTWGNPATTITNNGLTYTGIGTGPVSRWNPQTIYYVRITGNQSNPEGTKPQSLFTSMIHAREVGSLMSNIYFMWYLLENYATNPAIKNLVDNNEFYFIPVVNPDGLRWNEHLDTNNGFGNGGGMQRKNCRPNTGSTSNTTSVRGVDLNRNFDYFWGTAGSGSSNTASSDSYRGPSAFSEPETQILRDFVQSRNFKTCLMNHTSANSIPHPYGGNPSFVSGREDEMHKWHEDMTKYNRYISGATIFTPANGIADDWMIGGAADANGKTGSTKTVLASTPEHGGTGFWPPTIDIVPIAKRAMRISLTTAYYGGKYAKLHDMTQSDINSLASNLTFGIERLGQTTTDFNLTITPISSNITSIAAIPSQTGMSILEQRNVSTQIILNSSIQPNDKIEYNVQLSDGTNVFYNVNFEKYYQPSVLLSDNPDSDLLTNWTTSGTWTASNDTNAKYSGTRAIKVGSNAIATYPTNTTSTLTTSSTYNLSNSSEILLQFYAKWDLERNYDFVELLGSTNGTAWLPLCGKYTKPTSTSGTNGHDLKGTSASFQSTNSSGRVYDGDQMDKWIMEEIVIDAANNSFLFGATNAQFRFRFRSDSGNVFENYSAKGDGFFIDDFKIIKAQIPCSKPADIVTIATICSGNSYTWVANSVAYSTSQSGTRISKDGCTADLVLNLTVTPKPADIVTNQTICSGETFSWNGVDYTMSQSGTRISNDGCTADLVLNLTVTPKPADIVTNQTICSGETFSWNGVDYTTSQSGTRISNDGCTADLVLNLTVTPLNQYYIDSDNDGYGSTTIAMLCDLTAPSGYSINNTDCNDGDNTLNPGATEILGNGNDDDCNASTPDGTLEIDDFNLENITTSPNPFNNKIDIRLPQSYNNSEFNITIMDLNGRLVFRKKYVSTNEAIKVTDLNHLEQAPYLVKITSTKTGNTIYKRLVKY